MNLTKEGIHEAKCLGSLSSYVSKVSTTYQRTLSAGLWLHILNCNETLPWLSFSVVSLGEVLQDSRSKGCWTETTQYQGILYSTHRSFPLFLRLSVGICPCLLPLCLFLLLLLSFWHFTSLSSCLYFSLFPFLVSMFNLRGRSAHECLLEVSGKTYSQENGFDVAQSLLNVCAP